MLKFLTGLLLVMFPVGLVIMLTDFGRGYLWTTSLFLGLQALILFILIYKTSRLFLSISVVLIIFISSFSIELLGLKTSYPFGTYTYSDILAPQLFGVPAAIAFAWFSVTVSSYLIAADLYGKYGVFTISLISSALIFSTDILLEPFASFINGFWIWEGGRIPLQNFISWLVIGFLFSLVVSQFIKPGKLKELSPFIRKIPYIILTLNVLNFLTLNLINNYIFISVIGTTIIVFILFLLPVFAKNEV
jgi:bisanhydrobacterioruberin hydratase